LLYRLSYT